MLGGAGLNKKAVYLLCVSTILACAVAFYVAAPGIILSRIAGTHNIDIAYRSMKVRPLAQYNNEKGFFIALDMKDVLVRKKGVVQSAYNDLVELVSAPFAGSWRYDTVKGVLKPAPGKMFIENLQADSKMMQVSVRGDYKYSANSIDIDMTIRFSPELMHKISPELSSIALSPIGNEWGSLSVNLKGATNSPAVQITGKLFRLSIREVSG
jgi:hypothetical protein